jgi:hypothetical protein
MPAFPARWFYGFLRALPGDRAFLPPSSTRCEASSPTWRQRRGARTTRLRRPLWRRLVLVGAVGVHRIPRSTFVTTRNAPPDERGTGEVLEVICPTVKAKNFSQADWTGQINLKWLANIVFWRRPNNLDDSMPPIAGQETSRRASCDPKLRALNRFARVNASSRE